MKLLLVIVTVFHKWITHAITRNNLNKDTTTYVIYIPYHFSAIYSNIVTISIVCECQYDTTPIVVLYMHPIELDSVVGCIATEYH